VFGLLELFAVNNRPASGLSSLFNGLFEISVDLWSKLGLTRRRLPNIERRLHRF
jgi:hypothetical protein